VTSSKLTKKQEAFCREYILNGGNGTLAAIKAGYNKHTAKVIASENLTKPYIAAFIEENRKVEHEAFILSKEDKLKKLQEIIDMALGEYIDAIGNKRRENLNAAINAIKEHNTMQGDNSSSDKDNNESQSITINFVDAKKQDEH